MFCPKCGTQQARGGRACIKCNAPLASMGGANANPPDNQPNNQLPNNYQNNQPINNYQGNQPPNYQFPPANYQNNQPANYQNNQPPDYQNSQPPNYQNNQPFNYQNNQPANYQDINRAQNFPVGQPQEFSNRDPLPYAPYPEQQPYANNQYPGPPPAQNGLTPINQIPPNPSITDSGYRPGKYLNYSPEYQEYKAEQQAEQQAVNYPINYPVQQGWTGTNKASTQAIAAVLFGIAAFLFCPVIPALIAIFLGKQELTAIAQGRSAPAGKSFAQIGFYIGLANLGMSLVGFLLFFLMIVFS